MSEASSRPQRPLGWWLKEADARIDAAFERTLALHGLDRRRWQILATAARGPTSRTQMAAALSRFDGDAEIAEVVDALLDRGMLDQASDGVVTLTAAGRATHERALRQVGDIRQRVGAALGEQGYDRLVELLAQVVDALDHRSHSNGA